MSDLYQDVADEINRKHNIDISRQEVKGHAMAVLYGTKTHNANEKPLQPRDKESLLKDELISHIEVVLRLVGKIK